MRRTVVGIVTSAKMHKSIRVEVPRLIKHPRYSKFVRRRTICYAHDENNQAQQGDRVEIMECRPRSKMKCWELVQILERAAAPAEEPAESETAL
jgi:small subunit ribosomal protein S17